MSTALDDKNIAEVNQRIMDLSGKYHKLVLEHLQGCFRNIKNNSLNSNNTFTKIIEYYKNLDTKIIADPYYPYYVSLIMQYGDAVCFQFSSNKETEKMEKKHMYERFKTEYIKLPFTFLPYFTTRFFRIHLLCADPNNIIDFSNFDLDQDDMIDLISCALIMVDIRDKQPIFLFKKYFVVKNIDRKIDENIHQMNDKYNLIYIMTKLNNIFASDQRTVHSEWVHIWEVTDGQYYKVVEKGEIIDEPEIDDATNHINIPFKIYLM